ncbi:MAG: DUF560 domain-containing protein [Sulfitobacter sp.]|nr:DUF560 domain-containing protein [Sulfitobacter sp.]
MARPRAMRLSYVAFSLALYFSATAQAQVTLAPDSMRQAAVIALREGDAPRAQAFAEALLERDADDLNAHLIRSRALRDQGKVAPARAAARRAWTLAETDADKYAAALITAQVLSTQGKRTRAQLWLRRAAQHAPNDRLKARAKRDFRYVRARNRWSTKLDFVLAPNSNINNGSANDRSYLNHAFSALFGEPVEYALSGSAQALSGIEYGASLRTRYRFRETASTAQDLKFGLSYRSFILSESAKVQAPDVSGSDFAFGTLSFGYGYRQLNMERLGEFSGDLEAGQSWYGGSRYASYLRGAVGQSIKTSATRRYRFGLNAERLLGQATPDVDTLGFSASLTERFASGNLGYIGISTEVTQSIEPTSEYAEVEIRGGYVLGKPIMGAALQFGLGMSYRDYDLSIHSPDGRQDRRIFADMTATFTDIDYYGFNPSLTVSASRTDSNIGLYDVNRFGVSLGIKSAF